MSIKANVEMVSPARARELLDRMFKPQRPVKLRKVQQYAESMRRGSWMSTGEAIQIASDGTTLNGQHRLRAILDANKTVPLLIVYGIERTALDFIDSGVPRSSADRFAIEGGVNNNRRAAVAACLYRLEQYAEHSRISNDAIPHAELRSMLTEYPLADSLISVYPPKITPGIAGGNAPVIAGFCFAAKHLGTNLDGLIAQVVEGACEKGSPAYALRGAIAAAKNVSTRFYLAAKTVRASEAFALGQSLHVLRDDAVAAVSRITGRSSQEAAE